MSLQHLLYILYMCIQEGLSVDLMLGTKVAARAVITDHAAWGGLEKNLVNLRRPLQVIVLVNAVLVPAAKIPLMPRKGHVPLNWPPVEGRRRPTLGEIQSCQPEAPESSFLLMVHLASLKKTRNPVGP